MSRHGHGHGHEQHLVNRIGWLRAAVLGANDGILSTASLLVGVASAAQRGETLIVTGVAGIVAGAMSMAAGEYVSVRSQADTEAADTAREMAELEAAPAAEHAELANIYVQRGLDRELARQVATQLMAHDALGAHLRDELGMHAATAANPLQAAAASAATFLLGGAVPLITALVAPAALLLPALATVTLLGCATLGGLGAMAGGAPVAPAAARVAFWGAFAMTATAVIGRLAGTQL